MNTEQESIAENNKQNVTFSIGPSRVKGKMFLGKREDNEEAKNGKEQQVQLDKKAYECLLARAVELEKAYNDLAAECAQIEEDKLKAYNNLQSLERDLEQKHQRMESFASNTKAYKEAHDKRFVFMHTHRMGLLDVCNYRVVIPPRYEMMTWKKKQRLLTVSLNGDQFDIDINGKFVDEQ